MSKDIRAADAATDASERVIERERVGQPPTREAEKRKSIPETRGLTNAQIVQRFRTEMFNNVLPRLPDLPGYHLCWLSTTNQYDSLALRESWGYERVKPEELPGMEHITLAQGAHAGFIGLNEMVLAKIPMELYQEFMRVNHHERPYGEEEKIRDAATYLQDIARDGGGEVYLGDGTQEMVSQRRRREPTFE